MLQMFYWNKQDLGKEMKNNITSYMVHIVMGVIIVVLLGLVGLIVINVK